MRLEDAVNIEDLHQMAKRKLPRIMFDYIEGGVEDERGLERNGAAWNPSRDYEHNEEDAVVEACVSA